MNVSDAKLSLQAVAEQISQERKRLVRAKSSFAQVETTLNQLPTQHSDLIDTINGYAPTGAAETLYKDELSKLVAEFNALKTEVTSAKLDLAAYTEF